MGFLNLEWVLSKEEVRMISRLKKEVTHIHKHTRAHAYSCIHIGEGAKRQKKRETERKRNRPFINHQKKTMYVLFFFFQKNHGNQARSGFLKSELGRKRG